ncbi:hypothetical protein Cantr_06367 [Candida viswanathii]|uniref:Uncharacterized protein n=1 Tax=Candida viswanathii TaxID=5486 RepID=A0A367XZG0_9ASCO|nr:hypothetical protein Cantr_06367 [Candida viswanathii]
MRFALFCGFLGLVSFVLATPAKLSQTRDNDLSKSDAKKFEALVKKLQEYNAQNFVPGYTAAAKKDPRDLEKRSDLPILDSFLVILKDSPLCNSMIDHVLLQPPLLDLVLNTTIWAIEAQLVNMTNLFIALDKSNLQVDIIIACLQDPRVLPGLISITKDIIKESGIKLFNFFGKRKEYGEEVVQQREVVPILKRDDPTLNLLLTSLDDSGLGVSLLIHILTTPQLSPAAAHIMYKLLTVKIQTLHLMYDALQRSNLIWNVLRKLLHNPQVFVKFGTIITEKINLGEISATIIQYFN